MLLVYVAVGALLLGFKGNLQILRSKYGPSDLHGAAVSPFLKSLVLPIEELRFAQLHGPQRCLWQTQVRY